MWSDKDTRNLRTLACAVNGGPFLVGWLSSSFDEGEPVFEVLPVFERYFVIRLPPQMFRTAWRRLVNRTLSSSLVPKYPWNTVVVRIAGKLRM